MYHNIIRQSTPLSLKWSVLSSSDTYRGADKSLARPGMKQARATEDYDVNIS